MRDHQELQIPAPPRPRLVLGALIMLIGGLVLLGLIPLGATLFGVVLVLIGAGLVV